MALAREDYIIAEPVRSAQRLGEIDHNRPLSWLRTSFVLNEVKILASKKVLICSHSEKDQNIED